MKNTVCYLFIFLWLFATEVAKADAQEVHAHGVATLAMALENDLVDIHFESPAGNLTGFEHKASSSKENQVVIQTKNILESPEQLFLFTGTSCSTIEKTVDVSAVMNSEYDDHHKHEPQHNHSKDESHVSHADITASYRFSCKSSKNLKSLSVKLFNQFRGIEEINAIWITETAQGAEILTINRNTVSLK